MAPCVLALENTLFPRLCCLLQVVSVATWELGATAVLVLLCLQQALIGSNPCPSFWNVSSSCVSDFLVSSIQQRHSKHHPIGCWCSLSGWTSELSSLPSFGRMCRRTMHWETSSFCMFRIAIQW
jgi:hypothetical protein